MVDRMSEELWMEVHNTVQEAVTKTIPKKKKWLSEEALQIAEERREKYTQLNGEFQRTARRDKKAFFSLLAILWNCTFSLVYFSLSSSAICKASSDNHFAF